MTTPFSPVPTNLQIKKIHASLPIFALPVDHRTALYTPGKVFTVNKDDLADVAASLSDNQPMERHKTAALALNLTHHAKQVVAKWKHQSNEPFAPECLTVYLSNQCNCHCTYCYSRQQMDAWGKTTSASTNITNEQAIFAAADMVIANCQKTGRPFSLVIHGGGEPTLHMDKIRWICSETRRKATKHGVSWWSYMATNGIMAQKQARWIARNFDSVGISCDGLPDIQNSQRPLLNNQASFPYVMQTIKIFHDEGTPFTIRATITKDTVGRQKEIANFLMAQLNAKEIRFEPVYDVDSNGNTSRLKLADAREFADGFIEAQEEAKKNGIRLTYAGLRPQEIHGAYCNVLRAALHVIPPGHITACFFTTSSGDQTDGHGIMGRWHANTGRITINGRDLEIHQDRATAIPRPCRNCINIYHCSRGCPQVCRVLKKNRDRVSDFHCIVALRLITSRIYRQVIAQPTVPINCRERPFK